jgi:uncharacterized protein (TIGR00255 family)
MIRRPPDAADLSDDAMRKLLLSATQKALTKLTATRTREGETIDKDIRARIAKMVKNIEKIKSRAPRVADAYHKRLRDRTNALLSKHDELSLKPEDLAREIAIYADRCDISEELQRFQAHIEEFGKMSSKSGEVGRRLEFITQEMLREANTMSAKANDAKISMAVVGIKAELEKVREQLENVE